MAGLWPLRVWWVRHRRERSFLPPPVTFADGSPSGGAFLFTHGREWARADYSRRIFETGVIVGGQYVPDEQPRADRWLVKVAR